MSKDQGRGETNGRLLAAATEVFADVGYRAATLREICRRGNANIAAVNYHFRDKEQLYMAVLPDPSASEFAPDHAALGIEIHLVVSAHGKSSTGHIGTDPLFEIRGIFLDHEARSFEISPGRNRIGS